MKKNTFLPILFTLTSILQSCEDNTLYFEDAYVIENVNLIDPLEGIEEKQTVVIKENKIHQIYNTAEVILSSKNKIYDGTNQFLIPGLWDAHIHFAFETILGEYMPDLFLSNGITSVRDTGGPIDFVLPYKEYSLKNPTTSPRVMIAGPLIDGKHNVYDGSSPSFPLLSIQNSSVSVLQKQVQELIDKKVDFLKAYEMLSPEQFKLLAQMAQANNLKLTGHVPLSMDVITASNLGLNSMEHLRNIELSMAKDFEALFSERTFALENKNKISGSKLRSSLHQSQRIKAIANIDSIKQDQVFNTLAKNKTWQIPTLELYQTFANKKYKSEAFQSYFYMIPQKVKSKWMEQINSTSDEPDQEMIKYTQWSRDMVYQMHEKRIPFMAGTDTPIGFLIPGKSLHDELVQLNLSGLSNLETLKAATYHPAEYFGLEKNLGRIKVGFEADLVLLDKNPLESIKNTQSIRAVVKAGKFMNRAYIDSLQVN